MLASRIVSLGNYCYIPLDPNKQFFDYNFEQEAELVSDRYLVRNGEMQGQVCNQVPNNLPQLEQVIPLFP